MAMYGRVDLANVLCFWDPQVPEADDLSISLVVTSCCSFAILSI